VSPGKKRWRLQRRHGVKTSNRREKRPARGGPQDRNIWLAAFVIVAFNVLLVVSVIFQPAGPRVSSVVSNVAGFVGPLLVLPLCFGALWQASRMGDRPMVITSQR
jgi:protein-S-isoprenylcysteine O-methyltransferase Ste14